MQKLTAIPLFIFLFLVLFSPLALATTQNITSYADSDVQEKSPNTNRNLTAVAIADALNTSIGNKFSYFMFDISTIPSGATINTATLNLYENGGSGTGARQILVYNTSNAWSETNLTWNNKTAQGVLQDNQSVSAYDGAGFFGSFNISGSIASAISAGQTYVSFIVRYNGANSSSSKSTSIVAKEYGMNEPYVSISYETSNNCTTTHLGSVCDPADLALNGQTQNIITYVDYTCNNDLNYVCPEGTICGQITPQTNITSPLIEDFVDCSVCWYAKIYYVQSGWHTLWTNCPNNPECDNCNGIYCQGNAFVTNLTSTPASIDDYTAGCYNPDTQTVIDVIDENGDHTTVQNLTDQVFPGANYTYNGTCTNTSTTCYSLVGGVCTQVSCPNPGSSPSGSKAGWWATSLGGWFGITDFSQSAWILSILISLAVGFILLYMTRESEHSAMAFGIGAMMMLVMFTLIGWFPAWVMIMFIVLAAFAMVKMLNIGGG